MSNYRDDRSAALEQAQSLREENERLRAELAARVPPPRAPVPAAPPAPPVDRRGRLVLFGALVAAGFVALGVVAFVTASASEAPTSAASPTPLRLDGRWFHGHVGDPIGVRAGIQARSGAWVVGDRGLVAHQWSDRAWSRPAFPTPGDLRAIAEGTVLLAVGTYGVAVAIDPSPVHWTEERTDFRGTLEGVAAVGGSFVAVGSGGGILWRSPEGRWRPLRSGVRVDLHGVVGLGDADGFVAVGDGGTILRGSLARAEVTREAAPTAARLRAIAIGNSTLFAAGDGGTLLTFAPDAAWRVVPLPTLADLHFVAATPIPFEDGRSGSMVRGATDGLVVAGARGTVLVDHLGPEPGWHAVGPGIESTIHAMTFDPWRIYADGSQFTIIH